MNTATITRKNPLLSPTYPEVILHYVLKSNITESAVLGTTMHALCGHAWNANETNYAATAAASGGTANNVVCPMCADMYYSLPEG
ncbi:MULTISPECIES: DUF3039 domain-containing protein [Arthrobacter]|uniref:DUF3039 domain-containing protein n=1 Tax=Arthrobacter terricola TaxID=2547396 RepID=A0A4V2ZRM0_9MICC|nr:MULTISPECIES: DUF3039 domain-containing protein [Arthrobacter]MBT8159314.1 DUF3039 domain-containing protein [Arthrobacter sp. GN70]TDF86872.1 DUF3039 domain-containing protein [Arthrobacter terricola]